MADVENISFSRRGLQDYIYIDDKNRIVYRINGVEGAEKVEIVQCKGHYGDK